MFCHPRGNCDTLNELVEHLSNVHHRYFTYSVRRDRTDGAIITVKLRDLDTIKAETEQNRVVDDPTFEVNNEAYFLSARLRVKFSSYLPRRKRKLYKKKGIDQEDINDPFVVQHIRKPDSYWNPNNNQAALVAHDSNPGRLNMTSKNKKSSPSSSSSSQPTKKGRSSPRVAALPNGGTNGHYDTSLTIDASNGNSNKRKKRKLTKRVPENTKKNNMSQHQQQHKAPMKNNTMARKSKVSKSAVPDTSRGRGSKRAIKDDPEGLSNPYTVFLRKTIFGGNSHVFSQGKGTMPELTEAAAEGKLFHSVNSAPLDVARYNEKGYDSDTEDGGAEAKWRLRMADRNLADMADMCAVEIYFFNLWNQFVNLDCKSPDINMNIEEPALDRANYEVWMQFVKKYGAEIKRMKMEAILVMTVTYCWEQGTLDAQGLQEIMREFKNNSSQEDVKPKVPPTDYLMAHRLLNEEDMEKKGLKHNYEGYESLTDSGCGKGVGGDVIWRGIGKLEGMDIGYSNGNGNSSTRKWLEKELESIETDSTAQKVAEGAEANCEDVLEDMMLTEEEVQAIKDFSPSDADENEEGGTTTKKKNKNSR